MPPMTSGVKRASILDTNMQRLQCLMERLLNIDALPTGLRWLRLDSDLQHKLGQH